MQERLVEFCKQNILDFADTLCMLERPCNVLYFTENGFLVSNKNGDYFNMHAKDIETAKEIISLIPKSASLICAHEDFYENLITKRFKVKDVTKCIQYSYVKETPIAVKNAENFEIKLLTEKDVDFVFSHYKRADDFDYVKKLISLKRLYGGYVKGEIVGFVGRHEEGTMGFLEVLPAHKNKGYGSLLASYLINKLLSQGIIPTAHIVFGNTPSICLQEKLGLTKSDKTICWYHI